MKQALRALSQGKGEILSGLAESKRAQGEETLDKLADGLQEFLAILELKDRSLVVPKQLELLQYVGR